MTVAAQRVPCEMSMCISTAQARTNRVSRRPLTKPSCHFVRVGSLSLWRGANFEIARATFSALRASRIPVVVARCELWDRSGNLLSVGSLSLWRGANFWDRSRNLLSTSRVSDPSRCGAVRILRSLAQPSQHFVRVGSLSLWRGANFWDRLRNLLSTSCVSDPSRCGAVRIFKIACAKRSLTEILLRELVQRSLHDLF